MAKTKKTTAKADIDFEQQLWDAANELRGAVAENQYKDYVLSLLFARHLSERYAERKEDHKWVLQPMFVKSQLSATQTAGLINLFYNRGYDRK